jgi:hypothetical protein
MTSLIAFISSFVLSLMSGLFISHYAFEVGYSFGFLAVIAAAIAAGTMEPIKPSSYGVRNIETHEHHEHYHFHDYRNVVYSEGNEIVQELPDGRLVTTRNVKRWG